MTTFLRPSLIRFLLASMTFAAEEQLSAQISLPLAWNPNPEPTVVGYKIHYGTSSGNYTQVHDAGNTTTATLNGLTEGEVYYCALSAYDIYGLESQKSLETSIIVESLSTQVIILEAEEGNLSGDVSIGLELDSNFLPTVSFVETLSSSSEGSVQQDFVVSTASNYSAWVRVKTSDAQNDQIGFSLNSSSTETYDLYSDPAEHSADWKWVRIERSTGIPETFAIEEGSNGYLLEKVSSGVLVDRVILTSSFDFIPTESLLSEEDFIIITQDPVSTSAPAGSPLVLTVGVLATEEPQYQWFKDGQALPGATTSAYFISSLTPNETGDYSVQVTISTESAESSAAYISIPSPTLNIENLIVDTSGVTPVLSMTVDGAGGMDLILKASSDLQTWESLGTFDGDNPISAIDTGGANEPRRYYKVVEGP